MKPSRWGPLVVLGLVLVGCKPYDFNLDGTADLAFVDLDTGEYFRVGDAEPFWAPETLDTGDYLPAPGAFEGQEMWHPGVVTTSGWESRNRGTFDGLPSLGDTRVPLVGDFTGDGSTERVMWDYDTATWHIEGLEPVTFGQTFGSQGCGAYLCECAALSDLPTPGDFSGDGIAEVAVFRPTDRRFHFADGTSSEPFPMGMPAIADYDGDGTDDLAVLSVHDPTWHFEDGTSVALDADLSPFIPMPAPADYLGEGYAQPVAFDVEQGRWILGSDTVLAEDSRAEWQLATTVPAAHQLNILRITLLESILLEGTWDDDFGHC
jgi:hypothetical protein